MNPPSVVQVCADRGIAPGSTKGAAQHLRGIASGLTTAGHRVVTFAARSPEGPFPVPVRDIATLELAALDGVGVVYERYSLGHTRGLELARAAGARFVLEVNAPLVDEANEHRPGSVSDDDAAIERRLLREADLVITVSGSLTRWAAGQRSGPTITVTNGFEPSWFLTAVPQVTPPEPTLAFIGHPKPWHGADRLPGLLRDLEARGHLPRLMIVGGGPGIDRVLAHARRLRVADRITVTGPLPPDRASACLVGATVGVAPYPRREPFYFCPLKIVDYLAAGLPVVSTRQGDIPYLVGEAGIVVDPDSDNALAEATATLLSDPDRAAALGAAGRARAYSSMTWASAATATARAIGQLDTDPTRHAVRS